MFKVNVHQHKVYSKLTKKSVIIMSQMLQHQSLEINVQPELSNVMLLTLGSICRLGQYLFSNVIDLDRTFRL